VGDQRRRVTKTSKATAGMWLAEYLGLWREGWVSRREVRGAKGIVGVSTSHQGDVSWQGAVPLPRFFNFWFKMGHFCSKFFGVQAKGGGIVQCTPINMPLNVAPPGKYDWMVRQVSIQHMISTYDIHTKFHGYLICYFDFMISAVLQNYQKMTYPHVYGGGGRSLLLFWPLPPNIVGI